MRGTGLVLTEKRRDHHLKFSQGNLISEGCLEAEHNQIVILRYHPKIDEECYTKDGERKTEVS